MGTHLEVIHPNLGDYHQEVSNKKSNSLVVVLLVGIIKLIYWGRTIFKFCLVAQRSYRIYNICLYTPLSCWTCLHKVPRVGTGKWHGLWNSKVLVNWNITSITFLFLLMFSIYCYLEDHPPLQEINNDYLLDASPSSSKLALMQESIKYRLFWVAYVHSYFVSFLLLWQCLVIICIMCNWLSCCECIDVEFDGTGPPYCILGTVSFFLCNFSPLHPFSGMF